MYIVCLACLATKVTVSRSQSINFVLIVEGRRYGLADKFTSAFKEVEDANNP